MVSKLCKNCTKVYSNIQLVMPHSHPPTPALKMSQAVVKSFETTGLKKCPPLSEGGEPYWKCYTGKSRTLSKSRTSSTTKTVEEVIAPKRLESIDVSMASTLLPIDVRSGGVRVDSSDSEPCTDDDSSSSGEEEFIDEILEHVNEEGDPRTL